MNKYGLIYIDLNNFALYNQTMDDRRKHERIRAAHIADLDSKLPTTEICALTKDVSKSGACVLTEVYLEPGQYVNIRLREEGKSQKIKGGMVVWTRLTKDNFGPVYQVGLSIPE